MSQEFTEGDFPEPVADGFGNYPENIVKVLNHAIFCGYVVARMPRSQFVKLVDLLGPFEARAFVNACGFRGVEGDCRSQEATNEKAASDD